MIAVIVAVHPFERRRQEFLNNAADLRPLLDGIDRFISIESFERSMVADCQRHAGLGNDGMGWAVVDSRVVHGGGYSVISALGACRFQATVT